MSFAVRTLIKTVIGVCRETMFFMCSPFDKLRANGLFPISYPFVLSLSRHKWRVSRQTLIVIVIPCILVWSLHVNGRTKKTWDEITDKIQTEDDMVSWLKDNLRYKNDDPWDEAPSLEEIIGNGYGDCKMLAGVATELLNHIRLNNWLVTTKDESGYHMFNVYMRGESKFHIINNARLVPREFDSWEEILAYFGSVSYVERHTSYQKFRTWFNKEIFRQKKV